MAFMDIASTFNCYCTYCMDKITLFVELHHVRDNDYYRVRLRAWFGLIRYTYEIPVVKVKKILHVCLLKRKKEWVIKEKKTRIHGVIIL